MVENKVVVITGASSGIGQATANRLAQAGAKVVLSARREESSQGVVYGLGVGEVGVGPGPFGNGDPAGRRVPLQRLGGDAGVIENLSSVGVERVNER